MGKLYRCLSCEREFILDDEPLSPNPQIKVPYCPYCGRKSYGGWSGKPQYEPAVVFVREE